MSTLRGAPRVADLSADLSAGLPPEREQVVASCPPVPAWTENLLFTPYDPTHNIGMWLHLGTVADAWELWEDRALVTLPDGEGVLSMWAYHRTDPARRPAGANLRFECLQPFRRWRVTFDGFCLRTPQESMRTGLVRDGEKVRLQLDLEIECATPVWDAHTAAAAATGRGGMDQQQWAKEHYEQLYRARGTVRWGRREVAFDGTGWRDHSRGPRGDDSVNGWGGHVIAGCLFPGSGRAFGLSRYWSTDGTVTLEGGYVVEAGALTHVRVVDVPRLDGLVASGEVLPFGLAWQDRRLELTATTRTGLWTTFAGGLPYGVASPGRAYAINWASCDWDGDVGYVYVERSDLRAG